jgi:hypothetical protein
MNFTGRQILLFVIALLVAGALVSLGTVYVLQSILRDPTDPLERQGGLAPGQGIPEEMRLRDHEHPFLRRLFGAAATTKLLWGTFAAIWISVVSVLVSAVVRSDL